MLKLIFLLSVLLSVYEMLQFGSGSQLVVLPVLI